MTKTVYTNSLYTSAILELERTADFIDDYANNFGATPAFVAFVSEISGAIRQRAEELREQEMKNAAEDDIKAE